MTGPVSLHDARHPLLAALVRARHRQDAAMRLVRHADDTTRAHRAAVAGTTVHAVAVAQKRWTVACWQSGAAARRARQVEIDARAMLADGVMPCGCRLAETPAERCADHAEMVTA